MQSRGNRAGSADERVVHPDWPLRAYPRRSRRVSGAEKCGQADLVGPVASGPGLRAAVDLARAGLVGAVVARARFGRLLAQRADQPHRLLRAVGVTDRFAVLVCAAGIAVIAWSEIAGRIVLGPSVVVGVAALALLPGTLVALAVTRAPSNADLTGSDVWRVAARGRLPGLDRPVRAVRTLSGPVLAGALVVPEPADVTPCPALP